MIEKCALISLILIFIFLYLYVKHESFYNDSSIYNNNQISNQLISEIARVLSISQNRINNLIYNGDVSQGKLNVSFIIQQPNTGSTEQSSANSAILANDLMINGNFKVSINGINVVLFKIPNTGKNAQNAQNTNSFFDNLGLKTISDYALSKYKSEPNDESLTKFYTLEFDDNYNIVPKM
jgi:hypothetical protein